MKEVLEFLSAPLSTDELKRQVETLREALDDKATLELQLSTQLNDVNLDLDRINAKTNFLISLTGQYLELSMPPPAEGLEAHYEDRKADFYDPLKNIVAAVGVGGVGLMVMGSLVLPATLKIVGFVTSSSRVSQAASSARLVKMAKVGRASVYLAIGASILELAIKMTEAQKINAYLTEKRTEFETQIAEADRVLARYEVAIEQAIIFRQGLLREAGVETVNEYLGLMNDAIKDIGEQSANARMARNLLRMGQSESQVLGLMPSLEGAKLQGIARRLNAEMALIAGDAPEDVAEASGLTRLQVAIVSRVLEARGDAVLGHDEATLIDRHDLSEAVIELQIDLAEAALPAIRAALEADKDLSVIAAETLVPLAALEQLAEGAAEEPALA